MEPNNTQTFNKTDAQLLHSNNEEMIFKYKSGIPTLRSSSHRVRHSSKKTQKNEPLPKRTTSKSSTINHHHNDVDCSTTCHSSISGIAGICNDDDGVVGTTMLPASIRKVELIQYDMHKYNFIQAIIEFLHSLDSNIVGTFGQQHHDAHEHEHEHEDCSSIVKLENFKVPISSLTKKSKRGILLAQDYLSQAMHDCFFGDNDSNDGHGGDDGGDTCTTNHGTSTSTTSKIKHNIVTTFDTFVSEYIIPHLKQRLIDEQIIDSSSSSTTKIKFYYQRPPTLRIQPGPARARVNQHKDKDYGHQNGELNFWIPLTSRFDTGVDLYVESEEDKGDYEALGTDVGSVSSFFGSGCSHYVNENRSVFTRVSLDFRVGIEPFYDPNWSKIGTRDDHLRRCIEM